MRRIEVKTNYDLEKEVEELIFKRIVMMSLSLSRMNKIIVVHIKYV